MKSGMEKKVFNSNYDLLLILTYKYTKYGFRLLILDYPVQPVSVENNRNWRRSVSGQDFLTITNVCNISDIFFFHMNIC